MSRPWMKFFPSDWRGDEGLGICSISARGLWIEMLCVMHGSQPYGELRINGKPVTNPQLAALVRLSVGDLTPILEELRSAGVFSEEKGIIFSRRMKQDEEKSEKNRLNGSKGGNPELKPSDNLEDKGGLKAHMPLPLPDKFNGKAEKNLNGNGAYERLERHGDKTKDKKMVFVERGHDGFEDHLTDYLTVHGRQPKFKGNGFWSWAAGEINKPPNYRTVPKRARN